MATTLIADAITSRFGQHAPWVTAIAESFSAIGTLAAVVVALWLGCGCEYAWSSEAS